MRIVLLPGLDGTGLIFDPLLQVLPAGIQHTIIAYPHHQKLPYAALVDYVLQRLPVDEPYILVGESFSGPIAYQVALRKPARLVHVVFVATFLRNPRPVLLQLAGLLPLSLLLHIHAPEWFLRRVILGMQMSERVVNTVRTAVRQVSPAVLAFRLREINRLQLEKRRLHVPVAYIHATQDRLVPARCSRDFHGISDSIGFYHVRGPHAILQACPQACANILLGLAEES